ncbi:MAG: FmdB family zinc ribbon protein [Chloroflexota bacterium]
MPLYTYRRADGTTFDIRQKFSDDPLKVDPETGQSVVRVVQAAGIIFKGSGFYVNDSKSKSSSTLNTSAHSKDSTESSSGGDSAKAEKSDKTETKSESKTESKPEAKTESKAETKTTTPAAAAD